ncbi:xaa-Pro aminopeptidase 3-like [Neocloeon triangulifer]|uniref:xaa-Pro aminopeptidase 3-like n=1 Tax=Neocloeon triangulifer TaxID=2078957 RepID=UPI00286F8089|nr:xaa-Pro aminopeptidase 3-like [Neocloeon triangulifer]
MLRNFSRFALRGQGQRNVRLFGALNNVPAGQPTSFTHPHLLKEGEILPGMRKCEFQRRRSHLLEEIHKQSDEKEAPVLAIFPSAPEQFLSEKIPRPYRQTSDLLYLSGCQEPGSALLIRADRAASETVLFVRGADPAKELWDGPRFGASKNTADLFGVDQVLPAAELNRYLEGSVKDRQQTPAVWYEKNESPSPIGSLRSAADKFVEKQSSSLQLKSTRPLLHNLRVIKSSSEIELMRQAAQIGGRAIAKTISLENVVNRQGADFVEESSIAARVEFECLRRGAQQLGYPPVVATGTRTNTIHYISNNNRGRSGDLALMDAGCEFFGYNSDITRTWPLNGRFSGPQLAAYEAVLDVQQRLIELLKTNRPTLNQLFAEMCRLLGANLKDLCLLPPTSSGQELMAGAHSYCPHHVSHFLGMDIHDTPSVSHSIPVQPGMIITVEPGLYIRPENKSSPEEFRGIGIRIEDDVLITETGCEVLSSECPKTPASLEKLMSPSPTS